MKSLTGSRLVWLSWVLLVICLSAALLLGVAGGASAFPPPGTASDLTLAWGRNAYGQCTVPAQAQSGIVAIAGGAGHSLALTSDGEVLAWGLNDYGQCTVPAQAQSGVIAIAGGGSHSLALTSDGEVLAWGLNDYGQCTVPAQAQSGIVAIAAGYGHSLALTSGGEVLAWGRNDYGQCTVPAQAQSGIVAIAAEYLHSLALTSDAEVLAWGWNAQGQCTVPAQAQSGIVAIAAGWYHSLALTSDGEVLAWGDNYYGQCTVPAQAQSGIVAIASGNLHSLALTASGEVLAWGRSDYGQCTVPAQAQSGIFAIAAGWYHNLALHGADTVSVSLSPPSPATVASDGTTDLSASATDVWGHSLTWSWDDGGASGVFSPPDSAAPTYTAPGNTTDSDVTISLSATATCAEGASDTKTTTLTVEPVAHTFSVTANTPSPATVSSGGSAGLSATFSDSRSAHAIASWAWDDAGAGGTFSSSAELWRGGGFANPYSVCANPSDGSCWVANPVPIQVQEGQVVHLAASGAELWRGGGFWDPSSVSVNPADGSCWVANQGYNQVVHLAASGAELWRGGGFSSNFISVSVNPADGSCWVADTNNSQVVHLAANGAELWRGGGFNFPESVSVNPADGSCWVADYANSQVVHLAASGAELWRSAGYPTYVYPVSVSVNPADGSCWVADTENHEVVHLAASGAELWRGGGFYFPLSVSVNPADGSCWVAHYGYGNDQVVHLAGNGTELWRGGGFSSVFSVSVNPADGSCWVADYGNNQVVHLRDVRNGDATYTAPANVTAGNRTITLSVTATCNGSPPLAAVGSTTLTVQPAVPASPSSLTATAVSVSQINLAWTDNTTGETGFKIERKTGASGTYVQIGTVGANVVAYQNTGLTANTMYYYRVRAYNATGNSPYSNEANATTLIVNTPTSLTATAVSVSQINLSWTDSSTNETGFKIERKTGASGTYAQIATVAANVVTYQNTGLTTNTQYYYRVRAYNATGNSPYSNEAYATTFITNPPSALAATALVTGQINLAWTDNATTETGFKIERKTGATGTYAQIATVAANVVTYQSAGLTANTAYYYRVRSYNATGNSPYSNEAHATTPAVSAPSTLTAAAPLTTQINLAWRDNSTNETGVKIERKTGATGTYAQIATVGANVVAYSNTGLTRNTIYYYRVRAYTATANSAYSNEVSATTPIVSPPSTLATTALATNQIKLTWRDNATDETGFKIERKTGATGTWAQIATTGANVVTYTNTGLAANTTYYYRVRAYNASGNSPYSNEAYTATFIVNPPSTLVATALSATQIKLTWRDNATNETGFKIERKTGATGTWAQIATAAANVVTYTNTGLTTNTTYYYRVRAYNATGNSPYSNEAYTATFIVNPPSTLAATALSATQIKLTWTDNATNETGFKIERKTGATGTYAQIATVAANIVTYTNTGLTTKITYYYRVRAYNATGNSPYSNEAHATTP